MSRRTSVPDDVLRSVGVEPDPNGYQPRATNLTDLGNAERFVRDHGESVRYCHPWGKWFVYDGKRWVADDTGEVERMMKGTARGIYAEAADEHDDKARRQLVDHAKRSESKRQIADALYLARSEPGIPVKPAQLDADPWLLNCLNGTVDLRTGELRKHCREDLITKIAGAEYDPRAPAPTFAKFLDRVLQKRALRRFVQRAVGYAATGVVTEEVLLILHGTGDNGKTTLICAILDTLGDYGIQAASELLLAKRGTHPTELTDLFGARFVACSETDDGRRLAEGLVKQITGRDRIRARRMREDFWQFEPTHTVFLATNHRPEVRGTDHAIWRRLKLVPFDVKIPEAEKDRMLSERLRAERAGILRWIVRGSLGYQRRGLGEPAEVRAATSAYRDDMDILAAFIDDRCVVKAGLYAGATPLYKAYKAWCEESGEKAVTQTKFGLSLGERGFIQDREAKTRRKVWYGIGLHDEELLDV